MKKLYETYFYDIVSVCSFRVVRFRLAALVDIVPNALLTTGVQLLNPA